MTTRTSRRPPVEGWKSVFATVPVQIPDATGERIIETIGVEVPAWQDEAGEIYLDGESEAKIESVKARHMGLLSPDDIRELRLGLGLTQREIARLLQLGEKSWTRWESGRERPSRSMNLLLHALCDGRIDTAYLHCRHPDFLRQQAAFQPFRERTLPRRFPGWTVSTESLALESSDESTSITT
jgi:DNA-binding transcriptional regulator YiaG